MRSLSVFLPAVLFAILWTTNPVDAQSKAKSKGRISYVYRAAYVQKNIDERIKFYLDSLGYTVKFVDAAEPVSAADGADLVIISANVSARAIGDKYKDVKIPILMWESDLQDDLRYTGKHREVDFGKGEKDHYIWLVNAPHPLSAGLPAGTAVAFEGDQPIGWGKPGLGASIIATFPGQPDKAIIYGYEKGATMDYDFLAPARRVMFCLNNATFPFLTKDGLKLFDAAVAWSMGSN
ncbi:hypothetical protein DCM91_08305 [Chitinophaga costaii]|nr:hypothetical protein [Chitinophaga costaii]PUZ27315.1 hypothetical protein DCM91_08305 [Chitinophaga costaii]